jgi:hypothetical protein
MSQLLEDLRRLRNFYVDSSHWIKGRVSNYGSSPAYCMMGAINYVIGVPNVTKEAQFTTVHGKVKRGWDLTKAIAKAWRIEPENYPNDARKEMSLISRIIGKNDGVNTRHRDILAVIDCAIKTEMEKETLSIAKTATTPVSTKQEKEEELGIPA